MFELVLKAPFMVKAEAKAALGCDLSGLCYLSALDEIDYALEIFIFPILLIKSIWRTS